MEGIVARSMRGIVARFQIEHLPPEASNRFRHAMSELVSILFAVVFGVGLSEIDNCSNTLDGFTLLVAYIAILLSWWGYHYGTIRGPGENNYLLYLIDVLIVVGYWFLIRMRLPVSEAAFYHASIFVGYFAWEVVRHYQSDCWDAQPAIVCNFVFMSAMWGVYGACRLLILPAWLIVSAVLLLLFAYRWRITRTYTQVAEKGTAPTGEAEQRGHEDQDARLLQAAMEAQERALPKLSGYSVGAAVLGESEHVYGGCNVEFDNYSNTIHAEEGALAAAVAGGETRLRAVAVVTPGPGLAWPCGMCRQSLFELGGPELRVIASDGHHHETRTLGQLLPSAFTL